jgi:hypothetical protein
MLQLTYPRWMQTASQGDPKATVWVERFRDLGAKLSMRIE